MYGDNRTVDLLLAENEDPSVGGSDKIYGGSNLLSSVLVGGIKDDYIVSGDNVTGVTLIYADNLNNSAPTTIVTNKNDGDDIIEVGDNNTGVIVFG